MTTPDKLYCMHRLSGDYSCSTTPFAGGDEYIRKDALLEWVNKKLQESAERLDFHANQAYGELTDKLNLL